MEYKIQPYRKGQEKDISKLVGKVYDEYVAPDYTEKGNRFFYDWIEPEKIADRQVEQSNLLVATNNTRIIGMIEIRENRNISLLFVDQNYHGKGIARELYKAALEICCSRDKQLNKFYVHASPFSIPVYERLGFKATGKMQEEHGIKYLPMEMDLKNN
ncbi:GNAT family N-acetyltransferase [Saccharicrinis sp. FJH62]|uniref:GNAT family N-acetyltransferase n=1 Tax=Saccharicrinis sp. FJH62 TaxID=3344657 RepID=UPI0035D4A9A6